MARIENTFFNRMISDNVLDNRKILMALLILCNVQEQSLFLHNPTEWKEKHAKLYLSDDDLQYLISFVLKRHVSCWKYRNRGNESLIHLKIFLKTQPHIFSNFDINMAGLPYWKWSCRASAFFDFRKSESPDYPALWNSCLRYHRVRLFIHDGISKGIQKRAI